MASSPLFGYFTLGASLLAYTSLCILYIPKSNSGVCEGSFFLISVGFSVMYSSLIAKTWRIKQLFTNRDTIIMSKNVRWLKDRALVTGIALFTSWDVLIFTIWTTVDKVRVVRQVDLSNPNADVLQCTSHNWNMWIVLVVSPKILAMIYGAFLAFSVRSVPSKFNESKALSAALYNAALIVLFVGPVLQTLSLQIVLVHIVAYIGTWMLFTTTIVLMFVPKFWYIFNNPVDVLPKEEDLHTPQHLSVNQRSRSRRDRSHGVSHKHRSMPKAETQSHGMSMTLQSGMLRAQYSVKHLSRASRAITMGPRLDVSLSKPPGSFVAHRVVSNTLADEKNIVHHERDESSSSKRHLVDPLRTQIPKEERVYSMGSDADFMSAKSTQAIDDIRVTPTKAVQLRNLKQRHGSASHASGDMLRVSRSTPVPPAFSISQVRNVTVVDSSSRVDSRSSTNLVSLPGSSLLRSGGDGASQGLIMQRSQSRGQLVGPILLDPIASRSEDN